MKRLLVKRNDGGVSIITPGDAATPEKLESVAKAIEGYVSHREIDPQDIPEDRTYREAWTDDYPTSTIDINIEKAQEIHLNELRRLRKPKLDALDIEYQRADEEGNLDRKKEVAEEKQELRDVTKIVLSDDIEVLKDQIPDILK